MFIWLLEHYAFEYRQTRFVVDNYVNFWRVV